MMTYLEWRTANPTVLTEKTELDEATIQLLSDWFDSRFLCDDDNFERFFVRQINLDYWQYNQLLRLQSVEFDPMVSQYLERWVNRTGTQDNTSKTTGKTSDSGTGSSTVEGTASSTPGVTETSETTRTPNTTTTSTSTPGVRESTETIHTPNTKVTSTGSSDGDSSGTSETSSQTTDASINSGTNSTEVTSSTNTKSLSGVLPDSSTYAPQIDESQNPNVDQNGFPLALNWTYAANQSGSAGLDSSSTVNTTSANTNAQGTSSSNVTDNTTTHTESESTTTTSGTDTTTVATTRTGSDETTTTSTGTETTVVETSRSGSDHSTSNTTTTSEDQRSGTSETDVTGSSSFDHTDKEISTGRGEAPQDMLQRAKSYIMNMNAFEWLVKDLDKCFLGVYNI